MEWTNIVYGNFGDTHTFTFCIARNKSEASDIVKGLNILNSLEEEYELKKIWTIGNNLK